MKAAHIVVQPDMIFDRDYLSRSDILMELRKLGWSWIVYDHEGRPLQTGSADTCGDAQDDALYWAETRA